MALKKVLFTCLFFIGLWQVGYSQDTNDVEHIVRTANLQRLIGNTEVLNLRVQLRNPHAFVQSPSQMDDFVALGHIPNQPAERVAEFDSHQWVLQHYIYDQPWMGVADYKQRDIPEMTLDEGMDHLIEAYAEQGVILPRLISRVIIYKSLSNNLFVYDYVFYDINESINGKCREYLYIPQIGTVEKGNLVNCYADIKP